MHVSTASPPAAPAPSLKTKSARMLFLKECFVQFKEFGVNQTTGLLDAATSGLNVVRRNIFVFFY
jgi:hypothetical protein